MILDENRIFLYFYDLKCFIMKPVILMENNEYILEGNISVKAAIINAFRSVSAIYVDPEKKDKDTFYILREANQRGIKIVYRSRAEIDAMASGRTHGGMLAKVGERTFQSLDDFLSKDTVYLAMIEGIEDPFNFGYLLRTFYAAGVDAVILPKRNWTTAADVVTRASAGASEAIPLIIAEDMEEILGQLKQADIPLYCAERKNACSLYDIEFPRRLCIAIGGEMRGLSKAVRAAADQNIYIPYGRDARNALNAAAAAAIFSFEVLRQQIKKTCDQ